MLPEAFKFLDAMNRMRAINGKRSQCFKPGVRCASDLECCWDNKCVEVVPGDRRRKHCDDKVKGFEATSIKG